MCVWGGGNDQAAVSRISYHAAESLHNEFQGTPKGSLSQEITIANTKSS